MSAFYAWSLGFDDGVESVEKRDESCIGRTWVDNQDFNEAYDRGVNAGEAWEAR